MFIQLTQIDGKKIWFNSQYLVTIEPRKSSGSLVVPLGDGLDYEVRESPETVLALIEGRTPPAAQPAPPAVPTIIVSSTEPPAAQSEIASPAIPSSTLPQPAHEEVETPAKPARRTTRTRVKAASTDETTPEVKKKTTRRSTARKTATAPAPVLSDDQLARLKKMQPSSEKKLANTLKTQFNVDQPESVMQHLAAEGHLSMTDQGHVDWS